MKKKESLIKRTIENNIYDNVKIYTILIIIFFIGIVLGIIFVNNTNQIQQEQISQYINNFMDKIKNGDQISPLLIIKSSIISDCIIVLILWCLSLTIIGMPLIYMVILYKGCSIGYSISSIIATLGIYKGVIFIIGTMLIPYILYVPSILALAVNGINSCKLVIDNRRKDNIAIPMFKHTIFCVLMLGIIVLSSIIGAYISIWMITFLKN